MSNTIFSLYSPMEQFEIFPVMGINNVVFYLILSSSLIILINSVATSRGALGSPSSYSIINESLYRSICAMVLNYCGKSQSMYTPLLYTIFHLILFCNLLGLVPYTSTPTVELVITLGIAISLFVGIIVMGLISNGSLLLAAFIPGGTPLALIPLMILLEILAFVTRGFSLGLRLAVNLITGHVLAIVISSFIWSFYVKGTSILIIAIPVIFLSAFLALEVLIAYLQSYIFLFITCLTIRDFS